DPEAFVREFLLRHLALRHLVVGYNVNFGRDRAGSADTLRELGARLGFGVEVVGPVTVGAEQVSSTALREVLGRGDVREARRLLVVRRIGRLRGEAAFAGPEALRAAIAADVARARSVLAGDAGVAQRG